MSEKLRAAARQALEALRYHGAATLRSGMEAIVALEAALAEPEPVQEPLTRQQAGLRRGDILRCAESGVLCTVWATSTSGKALVKWGPNDFGSYTAEQIGELFWVEPRVQEPVAWMWEETASRTSTGIGGVDRKLLFCRPVDEPWKRNITPLYTHPPQRPPLTDEEIDALALEVRCDPAALRSAVERKVRGEKE